MMCASAPRIDTNCMYVQALLSKVYLIQGVQARGSVRTCVCCRGENPRPVLYPQALEGGGAFHWTVKQKCRNLRSAKPSPQMVGLPTERFVEVFSDITGNEWVPLPGHRLSHQAQI